MLITAPRLYIHGTGMRRGDKRKPKPQELKFQRLANNNQNVQNGREACEGNDIKPEKWSAIKKAWSPHISWYIYKLKMGWNGPSKTKRLQCIATVVTGNFLILARTHVMIDNWSIWLHLYVNKYIWLWILMHKICDDWYKSALLWHCVHLSSIHQSHCWVQSEH